IGMLGVVMLHTKPFMQDLFPDPPYRLLENLFAQPSRFAVPFFFATAGYFLGRKALADPQRTIRVKGYILRLFAVWAAWSAVYVVVPFSWDRLLKDGYLQAIGAKIDELLASPFILPLEGARVHLWFLPSLIMATLLLALCTRKGRIWPACLLAVLLFALGLLGGPYDETPLGIDIPFSTRSGPFLSFICLTSGYLLSLRRTPFPLPAAWAVACCGLLLQITESWLLWKLYGYPMACHNYLFGTVLLGGGILMVALAAPDLGGKGALPGAGRFTLGVYASHILFIDLLTPLTRSFELHIWQLLLPLLVCLLSLGLTWLLLRTPARGLV
ncbi:MAG: acyltransferase, partial [Deltaproteobacteria bacterium]|nr:acyltransferase [Deltaproteobacteria bacterium]